MGTDAPTARPPYRDQAALAEAIATTLTAASPGSHVSLLGSLAAGTADEYSDVDLAWVVPDQQVSRSAERLAALLTPVAEVASLRSDPDYQRSAVRRLIFVRFGGLPLFWRLDLALWAASRAFDPLADAGNPDAAGDDWSLAESAAMNGIATIKAVLRGRFEHAEGLLARGFHRIGALDPGGPWPSRIDALAAAAVDREPRLRDLARQIRAELARRQLPATPPRGG